MHSMFPIQRDEFSGEEKIPRNLKQVHDGVLGLFRDYLKERTGLALSQDRFVEEQEIPRKDAVRFLRDVIFPYTESIKYKPKNEILELINELSDQRQDTVAPESPFLPAPIGTKWNEVSIEITADTQIKIGIKGKTKLYHLEKFKEEIISQPKIQEYLFKIINSGGIFTKDDIALDVEKPQFKNYVTRLRKRLQEVFGILDEPLPFNRQAYRAQFSVSSKLRE